MSLCVLTGAIVVFLSLTKKSTLRNKIAGMWRFYHINVWPLSRFFRFSIQRFIYKTPTNQLAPPHQVAVPQGSITGFKDVDSQDMDALMQAVSKQPVSASWCKMVGKRFAGWWESLRKFTIEMSCKWVTGWFTLETSWFEKTLASDRSKMFWWFKVAEYCFTPFRLRTKKIIFGAFQ